MANNKKKSKSKAIVIAIASFIMIPVLIVSMLPAILFDNLFGAGKSDDVQKNFKEQYDYMAEQLQSEFEDEVKSKSEKAGTDVSVDVTGKYDIAKFIAYYSYWVSEKNGEVDTSLESKDDDSSSSSSSTKGEQVVAYAKKFLGNPYVWGGSSLTKGTDCSGFTMSIFKKFGKSLPHSSSAQRSCGTKVNGIKNALPGDIICYSGHVAIYMGNNKIIHASTPSTGIKISNNAQYKKILTIRRIVKSDTKKKTTTKKKAEVATTARQYATTSYMGSTMVTTESKSPVATTAAIPVASSSYGTAGNASQEKKVDKASIKQFCSLVRKANLFTLVKKTSGKKTTYTLKYKGDKQFAKYLKFSKDEIETCDSQAVVLKTFLDISDSVVDLSELSVDNEDYGGTVGGFKTYTIKSKSDLNFVYKMVASEDDTSYDGALAVISCAMNQNEYGGTTFRGKGIVKVFKSSGFYQPWNQGTWRSKPVPKHVKKAVNDAMNGKRNLPPYVLNFGAYKNQYRDGELTYKHFHVGNQGNSFYYTNANKKRLKKETKAYESGGSVGKVVYYNMGDEPWNSYTIPGHAGKTLGGSGCCAMSVAQVVSTLKGKKITPIMVTKWGYPYYTGNGWEHAFVSIGTKHYGLKCTNIGRSSSKLVKALKSGKLVIGLMGPAHGHYWTKGGHFIVISGINSKGKITVSDCGGRARSKKTYTPEFMADCSKDEGFWVISK